jgi:hypothetical protein
MPATNLFMNWEPVNVTPDGGTLVLLKEILDIDFDVDSKQEVFHGDARSFARVIVNAEKTRSLTISGGNVAQLLAIPDDTPCTITATLQDAKNGTGTGAITITLVNAVRESFKGKGPNNKFAGGSVTFNAFGNAGDVDPLSFVIAS